MNKYFAVGLLMVIGFAACMASEEGTKKSQELRSMVLGSQDSIIKLNGDQIKYYLETEPRPYDVVVFLTAYSCKMCEVTYESLKEAAAAYLEAKAIYPAKEGDNVKRAVYFAAAYYGEDTKEIFQRFGVERVPQILVSVPKMARLVNDAVKEEYKKKYLLDVAKSSVHVGTGKILEYANERVGRNVEHKETILKLFYVLLVLGVPFGLLIQLYIKFRVYFNNPKLWLVGSCVIYMVCMSGLVYCILHSSPWTNTKDGELEWWVHGSRSQIGMEGFVMSGSILLAGLFLASVQYAGKFLGDNRINRTLVFLFLVYMVYYLIGFVESIYFKKGGWTNPVYYPPHHYTKGGLANDQGNNI